MGDRTSPRPTSSDWCHCGSCCPPSRHSLRHPSPASTSASKSVSPSALNAHAGRGPELTGVSLTSATAKPPSSSCEWYTRAVKLNKNCSGSLERGHRRCLPPTALMRASGLPSGRLPPSGWQVGTVWRWTGSPVCWPWGITDRVDTADAELTGCHTSGSSRLQGGGEGRSCGGCGDVGDQ